MTAFVDTSAFYAAADRGDSSLERSKALLSGQDALVTSDHVLVETWMLLRHRLGRRAAEQFWCGLRTGVAVVEVVQRGDLEAAWSMGEAFPDRGFSIVDRTSFAVMQRLGVLRAVAFDDDFAIFRLGPRRDRAFDVIR